MEETGGGTMYRGLAKNALCHAMWMDRISKIASNLR